MNLSFVKKQFAFIFLSLAILITACTKIITTDIGGGLIPPIDGVNTKEMYLDVNAKSQADTITRVTRNDIHILGYLNDPLFGNTTASINVQLKPASFPFVLPVKKDSIFVDSVVLVLNYKGAYGDTSKDLKLRVYKISNEDPAANLSADSAYTSNYFVPRLNELTENGAASTVSISKLGVADSTKVSKESIANQVRVRLSPSYGEELLFNYDSSNAYKNDSLFDSYIKGFQIVPEQTGNSLMRIALTSVSNSADTNTKLAIYFHYKDKDSVNKMDTTVRIFKCNSLTSASTNYIVHQRSSEILNHLASPAQNADLVYVDANPGIYARISIPGIKLDTMTNKVIHRAELIMEQVPSDNIDSFFTAPNIILAPIDTVSGVMKRFAMPNDIQFSNGAVANLFTFGSYPYKTLDTLSGKLVWKYSFDMSRYIQGIITRGETAKYDFDLYAPSYGLLLYGPALTTFGQVGTAASPLNYMASGRVRLGGGNNPVNQRRMRLHIVYSDIK
jgi:hypothetical protein